MISEGFRKFFANYLFAIFLVGLGVGVLLVAPVVIAAFFGVKYALYAIAGVGIVIILLFAVLGVVGLFRE